MPGCWVVKEASGTSAGGTAGYVNHTWSRAGAKPTEDEDGSLLEERKSSFETVFVEIFFKNQDFKIATLKMTSPYIN